MIFILLSKNKINFILLKIWTYVKKASPKSFVSNFLILLSHNFSWTCWLNNACVAHHCSANTMAFTKSLLSLEVSKEVSQKGSCHVRYFFVQYCNKKYCDKKILWSKGIVIKRYCDQKILRYKKIFLGHGCL